MTSSTLAPMTLDEIDALLLPVEGAAGDITEGLKRHAEQEARRLRVIRGQHEYDSVTLNSDRRMSWEEIRRVPEVAEKIADGFLLCGVERDFAGRVVALLERKKP